MYNLLLVDDEPLIKVAFQSAVEWGKNGFLLAATASNGQEALHIVETQHIDAVITDLKMPGMDGLALIHELKKRSFTGPILVLSNYSDFDSVRTALTDAGLPDIGEHLVGQTAFITGASDVAGAAKAINTFNKASKKAEYKVAILDGAVLTADQIRAIGDLPPRDQLLAKLLGTINAAGSALARVIQAYVDKENGGSEEPAA